MAEHHFQHEGYEVIPNLLMAGGASLPPDEEPEDRLRLQHRADVAPAAPGRGFRRRRHPDQGPHRLRRRPRLSHARGGNLRRADARPERQPRAVRGAGRDHLQGLQQRTLLAQGQALHAAARGAVSRLHAEGTDAGAAADPPAGGDAGSRWSAPARAAWTSWSSTASRARSAAAPRPCEQGPITAYQRGRRIAPARI